MDTTFRTPIVPNAFSRIAPTNKPDEGQTVNGTGVSNGGEQKKCFHHRLSHCGRFPMHTQQCQQRVMRVPATSPNAEGAANSGSAASPENGGGTGTGQVPPGVILPPANAALLAERYLLLDLVDGGSLYKCVDVKTHEELVCKVKVIAFC